MRNSGRDETPPRCAQACLPLGFVPLVPLRCVLTAVCFRWASSKKRAYRQRSAYRYSACVRIRLRLLAHVHTLREPVQVRDTVVHSLWELDSESVISAQLHQAINEQVVGDPGARALSRGFKRTLFR